MPRITRPQVYRVVGKCCHGSGQPSCCGGLRIRRTVTNGPNAPMPSAAPPCGHHPTSLPAKPGQWLSGQTSRASIARPAGAARPRSPNHCPFSPLQIDKGLANVGYCKRRLWGGSVGLSSVGVRQQGLQVGRQQPLRASLESLSQLQPQFLVHGVVL